jgi:3-phosphoshikimate 1-carboxyvinyltransferase
VVLNRICLNPTRLGFFDLLTSSGAPISYRPTEMHCGEQVGEIVICESARLVPLRIAEAAQVQDMIDEIPLACAVATMIRGRSLFENAAELAFKETNRLETTRAMLVAFGANVDVDGDALSCCGGAPLQAAVAPSFGDHRISMSGAVLAGSLSGVSRIIDGDCFGESFPRFDHALDALGVEVRRKTQI